MRGHRPLGVRLPEHALFFWECPSFLRRQKCAGGVRALALAAAPCVCLHCSIEAPVSKAVSQCRMMIREQTYLHVRMLCAPCRPKSESVKKQPKGKHTERNRFAADFAWGLLILSHGDESKLAFGCSHMSLIHTDAEEAFDRLAKTPLEEIEFVYSN